MQARKRREIEINPALKYQKLLRRAAKAVRGFLVQKLTRRIKQYKEEHKVEENGDGAPLPEQLESMVQELQRIKQCSHDEAADHALPELGFSPVVDSEPDDVAQQILRHKKMREAVAECQQMLEVAAKSKKSKPAKGGEAAGGTKRKRQSDGSAVGANGNNGKKRIGNYVQAQDGTKALFVDSLSGMVDGDDDLRWLGRAGDDEYDEDGVLIPEKRKNRPGQRARRARFDRQQALDMNIYKPASERDSSHAAESAGRPPRDRHGSGQQEQRDFRQPHGRDGRQDRTERVESKPRPTVAPEVVEERRMKRLEKTAVQGGKEWKEKGLHPSWAAKQMNKQKNTNTIVAFQGKKISFADDDD